MLNRILQWLFVALGFLITLYYVPGFYVKSFPAALLAALIVGLLNIFLWPILALLTLPLTIVTFGLFLFVVNALVLKAAAALSPGFLIVGLWPAIMGGILITLFGWMGKALFGKRKFKS